MVQAQMVIRTTHGKRLRARRKVSFYLLDIKILKIIKLRLTEYDRSTLASSVDSVGKSAHPSTAPETLTKRQRQNANRYDAIKAEKDAQERDRLDRLADHKRELERVRISEQHAKGGKKVLSGGMQAVVEDGKLIWE